MENVSDIINKKVKIWNCIYNMMIVTRKNVVYFSDSIMLSILRHNLVTIIM